MFVQVYVEGSPVSAVIYPALPLYVIKLKQSGLRPRELLDCSVEMEN